MLKTGMRGSMGRDHRRILGRSILERWLSFFWSRGGLIFIVVIVALPRKIFWSFVLVGRAALGKKKGQSAQGISQLMEWRRTY